MLPARSTIRKFALPVAAIACAAWTFGFCYMYTQMPKGNLGIAILLVFTGGLLALPWLAIALNVYQRLRNDAAAARVEHVVADDPKP